MAKPKLNKEEESCPICKIPLTDMLDSTEIIKTKDVDLILDRVIKENYDKISCYVWECSQCGLRITITK